MIWAILAGIVIGTIWVKVEQHRKIQQELATVDEEYREMCGETH